MAGFDAFEGGLELIALGDGMFMINDKRQIATAEQAWFNGSVKAYKADDTRFLGAGDGTPMSFDAEGYDVLACEAPYGFSPYFLLFDATPEMLAKKLSGDVVGLGARGPYKHIQVDITMGQSKAEYTIEHLMLTLPGPGRYMVPLPNTNTWFGCELLPEVRFEDASIYGTKWMLSALLTSMNAPDTQDRAKAYLEECARRDIDPAKFDKELDGFIEKCRLEGIDCGLLMKEAAGDDEKIGALQDQPWHRKYNRLLEEAWRELVRTLQVSIDEDIGKLEKVLSLRRSLLVDTVSGKAAFTQLEGYVVGGVPYISCTLPMGSCEFESVETLAGSSNFSFMGDTRLVEDYAKILKDAGAYAGKTAYGRALAAARSAVEGATMLENPCDIIPGAIHLIVNYGLGVIAEITDVRHDRHETFEQLVVEHGEAAKLKLVREQPLAIRGVSFAEKDAHHSVIDMKEGRIERSKVFSLAPSSILNLGEIGRLAEIYKERTRLVEENFDHEEVFGRMSEEYAKGGIWYFPYSKGITGW